MGEQKILVTGGAGYIGSHACKSLKQAGFKPIVFDNLVTGWRDAVKFGPFEQGDLLNKSDVDRVFKNQKNARLPQLLKDHRQEFTVSLKK